MRLHATSANNDVYEGNGCAVWQRDGQCDKFTPVGEALTLHKCDGLGRTNFSSGDALRQLKLALHLTTPTLLSICPVPARTMKVPCTSSLTEPCEDARWVSRRRVECSNCGVTGMLNECMTILTWLTTAAPPEQYDAPSGNAAAPRSLPRSLLRHTGCVRELCGRARDVADEALAWDVVRARFACRVAATHRLVHRVRLEMYVSDTLRAMSTLLIDLLPDLCRSVDQLAKLALRYRTLMPAIAEATRRARVLQELRRTTSATFQSGVRDLVRSLETCHTALLTDLAVTRSGMSGLRTRYSALTAQHCLH